MISIVVAIANNNVIGKRNALPWYLPEDLKRFKELTIGHTVLMGRKTFESIMDKLGKPLPERKNVVITRDPNYSVPNGVLVYHSVQDAFAALSEDDIFVIGGGEMYSQTIDNADTLFITHIDKDYDGDVFFPDIDPHIWKKIEEESHTDFSFTKYIKNV